jgi:CheY-like chemotaxis protein
VDTIKVLMVDDSPDDCEIYYLILRKANSCIEFHAVHTVDEAFIRLMGRETFDCVLLDYNLGRNTGPDLLRRLQQHLEFLPSSFVMLTGSGDERHIIESIQAGAFDYINKSNCTPELLLHAIEKAAKLTGTRRELALQHAWRFQAEEELRSAQLQSAELAGVRKAVATYLHELNSPLTGILAYLDMLIGDPHPGEFDPVFSEMRGACQRMKHVLLQMEQLEALTPRPGTGNRGPLDLRGSGAVPPAAQA